MLLAQPKSRRSVGGKVRCRLVRAEARGAMRQASTLGMHEKHKPFISERQERRNDLCVIVSSVTHIDRRIMGGRNTCRVLLALLYNSKLIYYI